MSSNNPLCLLLGGLLNQNRNQVQSAMNLIRDMLPPNEAIVRGHSSEENVVFLVRSLLKWNPLLSSVPCNEDGNLPLHFAAALGYLEVARLLLDAFRGAAWYQNQKGKIPLHFAAREGRTNMVFLLLQACPETAQIQSQKAKLALHFAVGEGHTAIVERLLQYHPQGAIMPSSKGKIPLHFASRWGHMRIARNLIALHPESVRTLDWEGYLPLHEASRQGQVAMSKFLVELYPQGLATATLRGEIPLFSAVRSGNLDMVVYLVQAWPRGASYVLQNLQAHDSVESWNPAILELCLRGASGNFGNCAALNGRRVPVMCHQDHVIHTEGFEVEDSQETRARIPSGSAAAATAASATDSRKRAATTSNNGVDDAGRRSKRLFRRRPHLADDMDPREANDAASDRPFLALHAAVQSGTNAQVIRHVLQRHRHQITQRDHAGHLPLHLAMMHAHACRRHDDHEEEARAQVVLHEMLEPHPETAFVRDDQGRLALHLGLLHRAHFALVQGVLEANPLSGERLMMTTTTTTTDNDNNPGSNVQYRPPLLVAAANDCDLSVIFHLLRYYDPSVARRAAIASDDDEE